MQGWNNILHKIFLVAIFFILIFSFFNIFLNVEICKANDENILYVGGTGIGNYSTIQDAIDKSIDNGTIYVYNGTYYENIVINKSINLVGLDKKSTFIKGDGSLFIILIKSSWVNITRFTIENGRVGVYITGPDYSYNNIIDNIILGNWEGIRLQNSSNNKLCNNIINDNANFGIVLYESNNNLITANTFIDDYMAIFLGRWSDKNVISGNNFTGNIFGINLEYCFNNLIHNNSIANGTRGISFSFSKDNNATNNIIKNNDHSGIYLSNSDENIILPNTFSNNYQDIKKESKPPVIKTPGFEILFVICAILFVFIFKKKTFKLLL